jgi:hypothetical protein
LREEGDILHLAPGAPRSWFAAGQSFGVQGMATFFGPVSYEMRTDRTGVTIEVNVPEQCPPREILVHVRLPQEQGVKTVFINGSQQPGFDPLQEVLRLPSPTGKMEIRVDFE